MTAKIYNIENYTRRVLLAPGSITDLETIQHLMNDWYIWREETYHYMPITYTATLANWVDMYNHLEASGVGTPEKYMFPSPAQDLLT